MIRKARTVTGRLTGPRTVELDEAVDAVDSRVEVVLRPQAERAHDIQELIDYIESLPVRGVSKEELDRQLREERDSWGDR